MAKSTNAPAAVAPAGLAAPSFEEAIQRLEVIVEAMESGETPLASLLAQFEEGSKLLAVCEARLKTAELKIEQLKRQRDGDFELAPFAATEHPDAS